MAYNEKIAARIRELLADQSTVEEKKMFQGFGFMVNDKLCICVNQHHLLCRVGETQALKELDRGNCRQMIHNGKVMKDYVFVEDLEIKSSRDLKYWLDLCLDFNPQAKSSKTKKS